PCTTHFRSGSRPISYFSNRLTRRSPSISSMGGTPYRLASFWATEVKRSIHHLLQPLLPPLPIGHHALQKCVILRAVIRMHQVAELMDHHVVDATARGFDQFRVQHDPALGCLAAPAVRHAADDDGRPL